MIYKMLISPVKMLFRKDFSAIPLVRTGKV